MQVEQAIGGIIIHVKARPGSGSFRLHGDGRLEVKSPAEKGRANAEIIRELSKRLSCEAVILKGMKSRNKTILLKGADRERLNSISTKE